MGNKKFGNWRNKIKYNTKKWHIMAILILGILIFDLITKVYVTNNIPFGHEYKFIGDFWKWTYHLNDGAAWSTFSGNRVFLITSSIITIGIMFYVMNMYRKSSAVGYTISIAIGGALGNLYERIFNDGNVTDFISLTFGKYTFPTFNIADMAIVGGLIAAVFFVAKYEYGKK